MRLSIVNLKRGKFWQGSDDLWQKTAIYAASKGATVFVQEYEHCREHPNMRELVAQDNIHVSYRRSSTFLDLAKRVTNRTNPKLSERLMPAETVRFIRKTEPDVILINQSGSFNFLKNEQFCRFLLQTPIPYLLLCRRMEARVLMKGQQRKLAQGVFKKACGIGFAAKKNKKIAERVLTCRLPRGEVITSPLKTAKVGYLPYPDGNTLNMAIVGRLLCKDKGQDLLIECLNRPQWKSRNWHLNLYGKGRDREYLQNLADHYQLSGKITFHGHVSDLSGIHKINHLTVMPSHVEGTPQSILEAMSCGRAVLATDIGGNSEWVEPGHTGFLSEAPTVQHLSNTLDEMWFYKDSLRQFGINAFKKIQSAVLECTHKTLYNRLAAAVDKYDEAIKISH